MKIIESIKKIKGSTVIISFMYITWVVYIAALVMIKLVTGEWLPQEVTFATAGLFIVETVSLARLKLAKEGNNVGEKKINPFLEQIGLGDMPDFEEEVQSAMNDERNENIDEDVSVDDVSYDEEECDK